MKKDLTDKIEFIKEIDLQAGLIYEDKMSYLSYLDIAEYRGIKASDAKELFKKAKAILKDTEHAWMIDLSLRARTALIKNGYESAKQLYSDVMCKSKDMEGLDRIGHQVAVEVHDWCVKHKPA